MAFSVSPSVIIREIDQSASVPSIATSPAAIAGVFNWGPVNEPILITSEDNLVARFGAPTDTTYETFFAAADFLSYSNALYVARAELAGAEQASGTFFKGKYLGTKANDLDVSFTDTADYEQTIASVGELSQSGDGTSDNIISFNTNSLVWDQSSSFPVGTFAVGDVIRLGNDSVGYQELTISAIETEIAVASYYVNELTFASNYRLAESDLSLLSITKKWGYASSFAKAPDAGHRHIVVIDRAGNITGNAGTILELYNNVSETPGATKSDGRDNFIYDVILNSSSWITPTDTTADDLITSLSGTGRNYSSLTSGNDGVASGVPTTEANVTLGPLALAYDTFINANDIDISFILQGKGDAGANLANYIVGNIAETRKDCVVYLSPSKEAVVDELKSNSKMTNAIAYRNLVQSSSYWFMDSGYKYRYDKYNDKYRWVPLNGDVAGLASRVEPYESPAGFRKGIIKNVVKLAFNPSKPQRDQLYSSDINPVMSQVGQGVVLFGDRTGNPIESAFSFLNVRRLFIAVEKAIASASQGFLFELNDTYTQTQFKNIVDPFLRDIQGRRGIIDFTVICDSRVNTPTVVDQGLFKAQIFIKPARSIQVIELTFVATRSGIEFEEIVGSVN